MSHNPPDEIITAMYRLLDGLYIDRQEVDKLVKLTYNAGYQAGHAEASKPPPVMFRYPNWEPAQRGE